MDEDNGEQHTEPAEGSTEVPEVGCIADSDKRLPVSDDDGWAAALRAQGKLPQDESSKGPSKRQLKVYDDLWENNLNGNCRRTSRRLQRSSKPKQSPCHLSHPGTNNKHNQNDIGGDESGGGNRNKTEREGVHKKEDRRLEDDERDNGVRIAQGQQVDEGRNNDDAGIVENVNLESSRDRDVEKIHSDDFTGDNDDIRNETSQMEPTTPSLRDDTWGFIREALPQLSPPKVLQTIPAEKPLETDLQSWAPGNALQTWGTNENPQMVAAEEKIVAAPCDTPQFQVTNEASHESAIGTLTQSWDPETAPQTSTLNADAQSWTPSGALQTATFVDDKADEKANFSQLYKGFADPSTNRQQSFGNGEPGETNGVGEKERGARTRRGNGSEGGKGGRTTRGNRYSREGRNNRGGRGGRDSQIGRGGREGQSRRGDRNGHGGRGGRDGQSEQDFRSSWVRRDSRNDWGSRVSRNDRVGWDSRGNWGNRGGMSNQEGQNDPIGRSRRGYPGGRDGRGRRDGQNGHGRWKDDFDNSNPRPELRQDTRGHARENNSYRQHGRDGNIRGENKRACSQKPINKVEASSHSTLTFETETFKENPIVETTDNMELSVPPQEWAETYNQTWSDNDDTAAQTNAQSSPILVVQDETMTETSPHPHKMDDSDDQNRTENNTRKTVDVQMCSQDEN